MRRRLINPPAFNWGRPTLIGKPIEVYDLFTTLGITTLLRNLSGFGKERVLPRHYGKIIGPPIIKLPLYAYLRAPHGFS